MMNLDDLRESIAAITPVDEREAVSKAATLERLTWAIDPFDEEVDPHHVTSSAFVISERGVILHLHRKLNIWVQPGGHIDTGEDPMTAAVRETLEETGLITTHTDPPTLFHVDVHPGPRGHTHYDLRYVLLAEPVDPTPPPEESPDVFWFSFEDARVRCEPGLAAAIDALAVAAPRWGVGA